MSLIDDLRKVAASVPPSHVPTASELAGVVGALILHLEHPEDFLKAAEDGGHDAIAELISPTPPEPEPVPDRSAEVAELQARLAALEGAAGHPTVEVSPPPVESAAGTPPPGGAVDAAGNPVGPA